MVPGDNMTHFVNQLSEHVDVFAGFVDCELLRHQSEMPASSVTATSTVVESVFLRYVLFPSGFAHCPFGPKFRMTNGDLS